MSARRPAKKRPPGVLAGKRANVSVERGGCTIQVGDVPASQAVAGALELLRHFRRAEAEFPVLAPPPEMVQIGGYSALPVTEDEGAHRVGF